MGSTAAAEEVLAATLAGLPPDQHGYLLPAGTPASVSFASIGQAEWLERQIEMQSLRWPHVDRRVRTTLWWYSVSQVFLTPAVASVFVTGRALSPRPTEVDLHLLPDGRILTARSLTVLDRGHQDGDQPDGNAVVTALAEALRAAFEYAMPALARAGRMREPPLWALATDSLANRLLWVGWACGEVDRASSLAADLVGVIGPPMPQPRFVDVARRAPRAGSARFVRRASCCLIYLEPAEAKCASCPRLPLAERADRLSAATAFA